MSAILNGTELVERLILLDIPLLLSHNQEVAEGCHDPDRDPHSVGLEAPFLIQEGDPHARLVLSDLAVRLVVGPVMVELINTRNGGPNQSGGLLSRESEV